MDERLETLLDTERRLEARVKAAERAARERIDAARAAFDASDDRRAAEVEAAAHAERDADERRTAEALREIEARSAAAVSRASSLDDATIERLARVVYGRVIGGDR